jgi:hypothetical protein
MSMKIDYFPTDLCPTINDACDEVRLVDREVGVDFLRPDVRIGSSAACQQSNIRAAASEGKAAPQWTEIDTENLNICYHR